MIEEVASGRKDVDVSVGGDGRECQKSIAEPHLWMQTGV